LIKNNYLSRAFRTRIRGNLRAIAAMMGIASVEDIVIVIGHPIGASGEQSIDVTHINKRAA
jgi:hypothetical protein